MAKARHCAWVTRTPTLPVRRSVPTSPSIKLSDLERAFYDISDCEVRTPSAKECVEYRM